MSLAQDVASVFSDYGVDQLDFNLGGLCIRPHQYRRVAEAILDGRIGVSIDPTASFDGVYNSSSNTIRFKTASVPTNPNRRGLIIHEATHAIIDMHHCRGTTRLSGEVAAYMAQVIYLHHNAGWSPPTSNAFFTSLYQFAQERGLLSLAYIRGSTQLNWDQYASIRTVIHNHGSYASYGEHERVLANGI